ncbi:origin recognition complex subunit 6-domain-containing protein [Venturia nashicola]|nr:origin recognition complex subunit 6-domain-containing protein [Venturia nashicola]
MVSLLPSITLPLPPELVNLAVSLLAQSRTKASTLKPDEEIARGYACAHVACERLKQALHLPAIVPRPPCPPRTYKKVFAYLNTVLATKREAGPAEPETPKRSRTTSAKATPLKPTPSKTRTPRSTAKRSSAASSDEPEWMMTAIRTLCQALKTPNAAPHVFTGVSTVLNTIKERENDPGPPLRKRPRLLSAPAANETATPAPTFEAKRIPALIAVVTMYTLSALTAPPSPEEYTALRDTAIKSLLKSVPEIKSDTTELVVDIEAFMREATNGWLEMEWYQNIQPAQYSEDEVEQNLGDDGDEEEDDEGGAVATKASRRREQQKNNRTNNLAAPKRAFGTMMTDATDWLSDERRANYRQWKSKIVQQIDKIEKDRA